MGQFSVVDKHDLIQTLKDMAIEFGRTPTRGEFTARIRGGEYKLRALFGGFTQIVLAAGLDTYSERRKPKPIDNSVFNRNIERHLEDYSPQPYAPPAAYPTAAIISDIHWPFSCHRVVDAFYRYVEKHKPEWVILNGDAWDMYSHAKYPRSHNVFTPREEENKSRQMNEDFWITIQKLSPGSKCVQMLGNHDIRPMKRVLEAYPEAEDWIKERLKRMFAFDGVKTVYDPREELYLADDLIVFHGYRSKLGEHRDYTHMSCINGHTHVGGVVWRQLRGKLIFEANSGVAGDPMAKGLTYTSQKLTHWTPGFLGMDSLGPRFIPA